MESISPNIGPVGSAVFDGLGESPRLVIIVLAVAIANEVGAWESIATLNFQTATLGVPWGHDRRLDRVSRWDEEGK
jgi:hypothetical protein